MFENLNFTDSELSDLEFWNDLNDGEPYPEGLKTEQEFLDHATMFEGVPPAVSGYTMANDPGYTPISTTRGDLTWGNQPTYTNETLPHLAGTPVFTPNPGMGDFSVPSWAGKEEVKEPYYGHLGGFARNFGPAFDNSESSYGHLSGFANNIGPGVTNFTDSRDAYLNSSEALDRRNAYQDQARQWELDRQEGLRKFQYDKDRQEGLRRWYNMQR